MASAITELKMDIASSLWATPGTFEELIKRDFLKQKSERGIWTILGMIERDGWVYEKGDIYYTYSKTVKKILNPNGYDLDIKYDTRTDFEKAYDKSVKRRGY